MEEREGGFAFFCSTDCHGKNVRGETTGGATCDACMKRFAVELVSQVIRVNGARKYACSDECRTQVLAEAGGAKLSAFTTAPVHPPTAPVEAPAPVAAPAPSASITMSSPPPVPPAPKSTPRIRREIDGPRRLAIFNHKGGTGKTTTSVSIAAGLAERGLKVLLVDTDSQGNVGVSLDVKTERSL
jgi:chromosome partitioning protein